MSYHYQCLCYLLSPKFSFTCTNIFLVEIFQTSIEPQEAQYSCLSRNYFSSNHTAHCCLNTTSDWQNWCDSRLGSELGKCHGVPGFKWSPASHVSIALIWREGYKSPEIRMLWILLWHLSLSWFHVNWKWWEFIFILHITRLGSQNCLSRRDKLLRS